jgi:quercetin dioxygenase-like cupin family protein
MDTSRKKFQQETSWEELGFRQYPCGALSSRFVIGDEDDVAAPVVMRGVFPPNAVVAPHSHPCDYAEIILEGTQQVTRRWHKAGDIRIVKAGTVYGPLIAGPEGVTVLVIFRSGDWQTQYVKEPAAAAHA